MNPYVNMGFSGDTILYLDSYGVGVNFSNLDFEYKKFQIGYLFFWGLIEIIVFALLGMYLE
jgi:hypothetical protein